MQKHRFMGLVIYVLLVCVSLTAAHTVFLEAEGFDDLGGWGIDQQSMDQMGSPYLLAHGLGRPVADATTTVQFPAAGTYRLWVRTKDWVAPWKAPGVPGRFQLLIDDKPVPITFGTEGVQWHWQDGGQIRIDKTSVRFALHDLTGFDGRCDAILFSDESGFVPPVTDESLSVFRRKMLDLSDPIDEGQFDLVVVGGGIAGTCSAISSARLGLKVALIQDRPVLGGNNSSEIRVHLNGEINQPPYPALGNVVRELDTGLRGNAQPAHHYDDGQKLAVVQAEKNLHLFLNMHVFQVRTQNNQITSVIARHTRRNTEHRFNGILFADCTGDGSLGYLAGADFRVGRESKKETGEPLAPDKPDKMTMGTSVQWYAVETDKPVSFPECPWALPFTDQTCYPMTRGDWDWETGMNRNQIAEFEFIRDYGLRVAFGNWSYLKNHYKFKEDYTHHRLDWVAYIGGKRESRRLLGDVILQEQDIVEPRPYPDAMVTTTWTIDLHYPNPKNSEQFPGAEFRSIAEHKRIAPYPIPYRCLYSRNIENLFMAGRNISVTHVALGTVRVMRTGGMMGEVVGMAAAMARKHNTTPRGVFRDHLEELKELATKGVGKQ
ncbi:MAG: FAD-dependent oxidoreductase [Sedimentisphaerales bacterium]|nr:FAD-dependent oxidoreductase [Sedimentisphaerales bacterium]